jgi:hypothetical protein
MLVVALAMGLSIGATAAPATAKVATLRVVGEPALFPKFRRSIPDYVAQCIPGQPMRVSITVPRDTTVSVDKRAARKRSFAANVDVSSDESFRIVVTTRHRQQRRQQRYSVRCLPTDFPAWTAEKPGRPQAEWYVVAPCCTPDSTYVAIFDTNGVPVWWINTQLPPLDASLLPDGNVAWAQQHGQDLAPGVSSGTYEEHNFAGNLVRTFSIPNGIPTDRHEMQLLPNGNYVVVAYSPRDGVDLSPYGGPPDATVLDALVEEITPDRQVAWTWRSSDHIALADTGRWYHDGVLDHPVPLRDGTMAYDLVHINAVDPYGPDRFLVSLRHTDSIYAIDKASGNVVWRLGGTSTPSNLKILGDDVPDFGGQHDVRALPDGTISLYDNGTGRGRPPRALRFRIDETQRTATLIQRLSDPAAIESPCCGSARRLPGGNWVISWGGTELVTETTRTGKRVFGLQFQALMSYRAFPVLPGRLSRPTLRFGMDLMHPR